MKKREYIKKIEKMINPIDIGTVHFMQSYSKIVPKKSLDKIIKNGAKHNPYMGFVVEPYSFFLAYEITDLEEAQKLIPDNYRLVKSKMFEEDEPKYHCVFGCFNVHTSVFWGTRMEVYIIAENIQTSLESWIIIDYNTNTISYDTKDGLIAGNTKECVFTTSFDGEVITDIKGEKENQNLSLVADISSGVKTPLDYKLWIDGNLSVTYGRKISKNDGEAFSTIFNPKEMLHALKVPLKDVVIEENNWFPGLFSKEPTSIACFPFAQHYLSDSPGHYSHIKDGNELKRQYEEFDFSSISDYSSKPLKTSFKIGQVVSSVLIVILTILLIIK